MGSEKEQMLAVIDEQARHIKSLKSSIADLIKVNQKLYKKIDERHPSGINRDNPACECDSPWLIDNRSGPSEKMLCTVCVGWR